MRWRIVILMLGVLLPCGGLAKADVDFHQDTTIDSGTWPGNTNVYDTAILTVKGGDIDSISAFDNSTVDIIGGTIDTIYLTDLESATINLYGGDITMGFYGRFTAPNAINIYGKDFIVWQNQDRAYLSGKWADNSDFDFYFLRSNGLPDIVSLHIVPEPLTLSLLALGSSLILYKRRR